MDEILKKMPDLPAALRELIVDNADGNPFYAEELIKMLIDDRVILVAAASRRRPAWRRVDPGRAGSAGDGQSTWQVDLARLGQVTVPPTLAGILLARLDGLPAEERAVLQRASVVGRLFWDELVSELAADAVEPEAVSHLLARGARARDGIPSRLLTLRRQRRVYLQARRPARCDLRNGPAAAATALPRPGRGLAGRARG